MQRYSVLMISLALRLASSDSLFLIFSSIVSAAAHWLFLV